MNEFQSKKFLNDLASILPCHNYVYSVAETIYQQKALHKLQTLTDCDAEICENPKTILFHPCYGSLHTAIYKDAVMAKYLQLKGHNTKLLFCGGLLNQCSALFTKNYPYNPLTCTNCTTYAQRFCDALNINYSFYEDYIDAELMKTIASNIEDEYRGINIMKYAKQSAKRYYKGEDFSEYDGLLTKKLVDAAISTEVAEQTYVKDNPDVIVTSHGCYAEWGPFADYYKNLQVPVHVWYTGYHPQSLVFNLTSIDANFDAWFKNHPKLLPHEKYRLQMLLKNRKMGYGDTLLYGFKDRFVSEDTYKKTFVLFPNAPWDADETCKDTFFDSIIDWVFYTIDVFKNRPEEQLIIRTHPAESVYQSSKTVFDAIKSDYLELPKNIKIIAPTSSISSYSLFDVADVGIVSNGTVGLELLLSDIPVITVGGAHYKNKGFTIDATTKEEYLMSINSDLKIQNKEKLNNYGYYYFCKSFLPTPFWNKVGIFDIHFTFDSWKEVKENKMMNHIGKCILENKSFQEW